MQSISTIGLDIAKSVFQVHGVDAAGQVVIRRQLKRRFVQSFFEKLPPCHRSVRLIAPLVPRAASSWGVRLMRACPTQRTLGCPATEA
jgi:hypothetical protein